jgi:hypothetical protein
VSGSLAECLSPTRVHALWVNQPKPGVREPPDCWYAAGGVRRNVSGVRTVAKGNVTTVAGITFDGYGSSHDAYPHAYLTAAAAIGTELKEVDAFCARLDKCLTEVYKKMAARVANGSEQPRQENIPEA